MSVADIAVETGFGTQSPLTTRFRRRTTFTPAAYLPQLLDRINHV